MNARLKKISMALGLLSACGIAQAASVTWTFNLPSASSWDNNDPYPTVATLALTDVSGGVQFTLDPDQTNPGIQDPASDSYVYSVDFVYSGDNSNLAFSWDAIPTAAAASWAYTAGDDTMDSGYKSEADHIQVSFVKTNADSFNFLETATWTILGVDLDDFVGIYAHPTSGKPDPITAVLSVSSIHLNQPWSVTSSNWVNGVNPVPLPGSAWLFGSALVGFMAFASRRKI